MTDVPTEHRFYGDLAVWWSLSIPVRDVLELGSGGGHNAAHLNARFTMTLVDLSSDMLEVSRRLNPECDHHQGDMRTVRLGRTFDAVFVHDAVDYMTSEADLRQAIETAFVHCRPGGIAIFVPDHIAETFEAASDHGGNDDVDGGGARYLEWAWDPDPADTWTLTEYAFLLRDADGSVHVVHETHRMGLFSRDVWLQLLASAGFKPGRGRRTDHRRPDATRTVRLPPTMRVAAVARWLLVGPKFGGGARARVNTVGRSCRR